MEFGAGIWKLEFGNCDSGIRKLATWYLRTNIPTPKGGVRKLGFGNWRNVVVGIAQPENHSRRSHQCSIGSFQETGLGPGSLSCLLKHTGL